MRMMNTNVHGPSKLLRRSPSKVAIIVLLLAISTLSLGFVGANVSAAGNAPAYAADRSKSPTDLPASPES